MTRTSRVLGRGLAAGAISTIVLLATAAAPTMASAPETGIQAPRAGVLVAQAPAAPAPKPDKHPGSAAAVEGRIADLHKKLAITPDQEPRFKAYADVMRANAQAMEALFQQRAQNRDMTAPGMLHWHAQLTTAHADALNKLLPPFDALYDGLTATQKKAADATFQALRQGRPPRKAK
jgi:hypothetical protein